MRVRLNGEVVADGDKWLYDFFEVPAFSPQTVRDAIDQTPEGEDLTLEIGTLEEKADFFEEVFNVHPVLKQRRKL